MKSWLENNAIEVDSTHNEGKSVSLKDLLQPQRKKKLKGMTSKNLYIDKLHDIVNKYSSTYHSTIKMMPADVGSYMSINFDKK